MQKKITAALAVAGIVALGSPVAAEAQRVKNNSVTGKKVKNSSLTGSDIKNSTLTGADIRNGSLTQSDVRRGAFDLRIFNAATLALLARAGVGGPAGPGGPAGVAGPVGPQGPTGPTGATGPGSRWVLVNQAGQIEAQSGGFRIANAYPAGTGGRYNVYIDSGDSDLSDNGVLASLALVNQYTLDGIGGATGTTGNAGLNGQPGSPAADSNPEFSGEITATKCNIPMVVGCAPTDIGTAGAPTTNANRYFVVSPRNSDGSFTGASGATGPDGTPLAQNTRKRFYVSITGAFTPAPALTPAARKK